MNNIEYIEEYINSFIKINGPNKLKVNANDRFDKKKEAEIF